MKALILSLAASASIAAAVACSGGSSLPADPTPWPTPEPCRAEWTQLTSRVGGVQRDFPTMPYYAMAKNGTIDDYSDIERATHFRVLSEQFEAVLLYTSWELRELRECLGHEVHGELKYPRG